MTSITIDLPMPPAELSPNARVHWAAKSRAAKKYRRDCKYLAGEYAADWKKKFGAAKTAAMTLIFYRARKGKFDTDNAAARFKNGRDGIADAFGVDDAMFQPITIIVAEETVKDGMVRVLLRAVK